MEETETTPAAPRRGRPRANRDPKDLRARYEYVRMRFPDHPAAQSQGATVQAMKVLGRAGAPQNETAFNTMLSGGAGANMRWLSLLSKAFGLDVYGVTAEAWYEASERDFYDRIDQAACHRPLDVLSSWAAKQPAFELAIARTSPNWRSAKPPPTLAALPCARRGLEVGHKSEPTFPCAVVAPGDGVVLEVNVSDAARLRVFNVDDVRGAPVFYDLTPFLSFGDEACPPGRVSISLAGGSAIPVGREFIGHSRLFVLFDPPDSPIDAEPHSPNGELKLAQARNKVISAMRAAAGAPCVAAHDLRTIDLVTPDA